MRATAQTALDLELHNSTDSMRGAMYLKLHLVALRLKSRDLVHPACQLCPHVGPLQSVIAQRRQQPQVHGTTQPAPSQEQNIFTIQKCKFTVPRRF